MLLLEDLFGIMSGKGGDSVIKVAICDDNKQMLEFLEKEIDTLICDQEMEHSISTFSMGKAFLEQHKISHFDVVFLDIRMPEMDGFEVAAKMRDVFDKTYIIFVTNEDSLVYDSFDFQPFYFIPKSSPEMTRERLKHVVDKLTTHISAFKKIVIPMPYGLKRSIDPADILFIKSNGNNVEYRLKDGEKIKIRRKLDEIMEELSPLLFLRPHKSYAVNMGFIDTINFPRLQIFLEDGTVVDISRARRKEVEDLYSEYLSNFGR